MTWRLFLDDERFPVEDDGTPLGNNFIIARTVEEAQNLIMLYGMFYLPMVFQKVCSLHNQTRRLNCYIYSQLHPTQLPFLTLTPVLAILAIVQVEILCSLQNLSKVPLKINFSPIGL